MPSMANIVVKANDNITDVTFDAVTGAGGDGSPAVWRRDTGAPAALPQGMRTTFSIMTKWNGPKTARQVHVNFVSPHAILSTDTGTYTVQDRAVFNGMFTLPGALPQSEINEAVSRFFHLLASTLIKDSGKAGYAPI